MSRNKLLIALLIALMLPQAALADDLIDEQLLVPESANYDTLTIEYGDYTKSVTAAGYQVFVVEQDLSMEEGTARLAKVHVIRNAEVHAGDVLVVPYTTNELLPYLRDAAAIICEEGSAECHAATVGLLLSKPVLVGAGDATRRLEDGVRVSVDCARGVVQTMPQ